MTDSPYNAIETAILAGVDARRRGATICPSEVARDLWSANEWRAHMEEVRAAAARLIDAGEIVATQGGRSVDIRSARGPIRLGRPTEGGP